MEKAVLDTFFGTVILAQKAVRGKVNPRPRDREAAVEWERVSAAAPAPTLRDTVSPPH
jgi:hypothetical protein